MSFCMRAAGVAAAVLCAALPVAAQVPGLPVYNQGVPRGIGLYGDVGLPDNDAGGGTAYGVTGRAGFGFAGVTATVSTYNPDGPGDGKVSVGATGNLRVFGGPLVPLSVTLQGGVGYHKPDNSFLPGGASIKQWRFPVGVGFALTIPNPALAIKPWLAPRLDIVRTSTSNIPGAPDGSDTQTHFALSGGIELNLLNGFGLHAAYDRTFGNGTDPSVFGFGAHYVFRVPGL
ncbi:MAG: outer membrane beta-barrel protein [Gemmatimonadales bacterium]